MQTFASVIRFTNELGDNARAGCRVIREETRRVIDTAVREAENEMMRKSEEIIAKKSALIKEEAGRRIYEASREADIAKNTERDKLYQKVLLRVREKTCEFVKSPEYREYLQNSALDILNEMQSVKTVFIAQTDLPLKSFISGIFKTEDIEIDKSIEIGGVKAMSQDEKIVIDDTLDSRLKMTRLWFEQNSGLVFDERRR